MSQHRRHCRQRHHPPADDLAPDRFGRRNYYTGSIILFTIAQQAQLKAYELLDLALSQQASVIAFEKVFLILGCTFLAALPLLLLFRTGRTQGGVGTAD